MENFACEVRRDRLEGDLDRAIEYALKDIKKIGRDPGSNATYKRAPCRRMCMEEALEKSMDRIFLQILEMRCPLALPSIQISSGSEHSENVNSLTEDAVIAFRLSYHNTSSFDIPANVMARPLARSGWCWFSKTPIPAPGGRRVHRSVRRGR